MKFGNLIPRLNDNRVRAKVTEEAIPRVACKTQFPCVNVILVGAGALACRV